MFAITIAINTLLTLYAVFTAYKLIFILIGLFGKAKEFKETEDKKRFGVLIAARNEELVIASLIESIKNQNYPAELIDIYVVADNCFDKTAEIAKSAGAIVYERNNKEQVSKGFALKHLTQKMIENHQFDQYDYFVIFDSDNIVEPNFFYEMNKAMASGLDGCTCYRNSKNFKTNPISSGYSIHWYFNNLHAHRPRNILGLSTHVTGTGYVFKKELIPNGWTYTDLTEDATMSLDLIGEGKVIGYCEKAEIFDEQPTDFVTTFKQRLRWKRGTYYSFFSRFPKVIKGMFTNKGFKKKFACYDAFFTLFPNDLLSVFSGIIMNVLLIVFGIINKNLDLAPLWIKIVKLILTTYINCFVLGLLSVIRERKKIHCDSGLIALYLFLYPWYDLISLPICLIALFKKIKWHPITHKDTKKYNDIINRK